ncbi:MAG: PilZ domain-containing protein [Lachnospiraceae bacterium]
MDNIERRKSKRMDLESRLIIRRLDSNEEPEEVAIEIIDVSKTGIGFNCTLPLEIGAVYEAYLTLWTKEVIHAFIEIVRIVKVDDIFKYGGIFIGMSEMDASRIEIYGTVSENS